MSKKVIVCQISPAASEKTVKDFFLFCGKIKEFELIKEESSDKQIAYITFERETAAKTALMLTNAVIGDSQITVKPSDGPAGSDDEGQCDEGIRQEDKPKTAIFAEILANGYTLQDTIIQKGIEFDEKFGISSRLAQYLQAIQEQRKLLDSAVQSFDNKYHVYDTVTGKATEIDNKFCVQDRVKNVASTIQDRANQALDTPPGKQLYEFYTSTTKQVADVHNEARRIANEKKAAQIVVDTSAQVKAETQ
ncbi:1874_t:CDS:2 [Scutellospora calospora]|uniref:1874_t:CDS:1 n=1 Tax=Scutellospora calospora TaxID=85575 RepID=A0ACA9LHC1_9GLOM|nr:1874_t:CDS:2 [Scutellospora calospora]